MNKLISIFILGCFFLTSIMGPSPAYAQEFHLPAPGVMVHLSPQYNPPILKGLKVHPDNPFRFDFILNVGDGSKPSLNGRVMNPPLQQEATKLIKYFLASLTVPEKDLWVNLSPYEKNRIVPESFGQTEMGRDLLAEDYMLKQITASLIYPEDRIGKEFWKRIYEEAAKKFGTTNIPINTFNKVWIVPDKAVVYENPKAGTAYVIESKLKVMLEQDYLSLQKHAAGIYKDKQLTTSKQLGLLGANIVREIVIPELTKEVNEDKNFSQLRQVYNSLILAAWYKKKIKDGILEQVYTDKNKVTGITPVVSLRGRSPKQSFNTDVDYIYQRYLQAFKKGVFNYIKEEPANVSLRGAAGDAAISERTTIPRKYFSGGVSLAMTSLKADSALIVTETEPSNLNSSGDLLIQMAAAPAVGSYEKRINPLIENGNSAMILSLANMQEIVHNYFISQKRGDIDFSDENPVMLGDGRWANVIGYRNAAYRLLTQHFYEEIDVWNREETYFNFLSRLDISPRFLSHGEIKFRGRDEVVTEVERVLGDALDPTGPELNPNDRTYVEKLLDDLIDNDVYFEDFKPSHIVIGSIRRDGKALPKKGYIVDVSETKINSFKSKKELIQQYMDDMNYSGEDLRFKWQHLDPNKEIVNYLQRKLANLAMQTRDKIVERSKILIARWNQDPGYEHRKRMFGDLIAYDKSKNPDSSIDELAYQEFMMYVLLDDNYGNRMDVVDINNLRYSPFQMPVGFLLEHLRDPWISLDEYGTPTPSDPTVNLTPERAMRNKRLALMILFMERSLFAAKSPGRIGATKFRRPRDYYAGEVLSIIKEQVDEDAFKIGADMDRRAGQLISEAQRNPNLSNLGERMPLTFPEVFFSEIVRYWYKTRVLHLRDSYENLYEGEQNYIQIFKDRVLSAHTRRIIEELFRRVEAKGSSATIAGNEAMMSNITIDANLQSSFVTLQEKEMRKIIYAYLKSKNEEPFNEDFLDIKYLGQGKNNIAISYNWSALRIHKNLQGNLPNDLHFFALLHELGIGPQVLGYSYILINEQPHYILETERVGNGSRELEDRVLDDQEIRNTTDLIDKLIKNRIFVRDFKLENIAIGPIHRNGEVVPSQAYVIDVDEAVQYTRPFEPSEIDVANQYLNLIRNSDQRYEWAKWKDYDPDNKIIQHLEERVRLLSQQKEPSPAMSTKVADKAQASKSLLNKDISLNSIEVALKRLGSDMLDRKIRRPVAREIQKRILAIIDRPVLWSDLSNIPGITEAQLREVFVLSAKENLKPGDMHLRTFGKTLLAGGLGVSALGAVLGALWKMSQPAWPVNFHFMFFTHSTAEDAKRAAAAVGNLPEGHPVVVFIEEGYSFDELKKAMIRDMGSKNPLVDPVQTRQDMDLIFNTDIENLHTNNFIKQRMQVYLDILVNKYIGKVGGIGEQSLGPQAQEFRKALEPHKPLFVAETSSADSVITYPLSLKYFADAKNAFLNERNLEKFFTLMDKYTNTLYESMKLRDDIVSKQLEAIAGNAKSETEIVVFRGRDHSLTLKNAIDGFKKKAISVIKHGSIENISTVDYQDELIMSRIKDGKYNPDIPLNRDNVIRNLLEIALLMEGTLAGGQSINISKRVTGEDLEFLLGRLRIILDRLSHEELLRIVDHLFNRPFSDNENMIAVGAYTLEEIIKTGKVSSDELKKIFNVVSYRDLGKSIVVSIKDDQGAEHDFTFLKRDTTLPNNPAQLIKDHEKEISDQIGIEKRKDTGGIDFTPPQIHLETKIESDKGMLHVGYGIQFHIDPAILQQLKDAPGFVPVIINIQPMRNLKSFLETR